MPKLNRFHFIVVFLFLIAPLLPVSAEGNGLSSQPNSVEIESLLANGQKSKANKLLEKWMKEEKSSPWPWVQAAAIDFREKKYSRSLSNLKKALDKSPVCADAYYWRGKNYEAQNKPMDAANEYRAALIADENVSDAKDSLARVEALLGS